MNLTPNAEDLLLRSVAWMDRYWDDTFPQERCALLWEPGEVCDAAGATHAPHHIVRESAWYALGLLMRGGEGDAARAVAALWAVLANQFDEPGRVYHGTFRRAPEEPHPLDYAPDGQPLIWKHYDPNWREFIVTTFALILTEFEGRLPGPLVEALDEAIRRAVEGARARGLAAHYTNIALMQAQMLVWAGNRLGEPAWMQAGEVMGRAVYGLFKAHDAFEEYNSPTYYGTDIYALGLWQAYCPSAELGRLAAEMEALLWRDIAQFYHAGLRNVAGPYDRAYGMDMTHYVALLGMWVWLVTGREAAPFPDVTGSFAHAADFCFGPLVALLGARVPPDVVPQFLAFQGERIIERVIADSPNEGVNGRRRTVSAWLGADAMIGAQHTSLSDIGQGQFHPATMHWPLPPGPPLLSADRRGGSEGVGWVRLRTGAPVDAVAGVRRLAVTGSGSLVFQIHAAGLRVDQISPDHWRLPGLDVTVRANAPGVVGRDGEDVTVSYNDEDGADVRLRIEFAG